MKNKYLNMLSLKDWTNLIFVGIFIPLILFLLSPIWSSVFAERKSLQYRVISKISIGDVGFSKENWPDININYKGKNISHGTFMQVIVANTGEIPIKADDFEGPIILRADEEQSILSYRVINSSSDNMPLNIEILENGVEIKPLLLNPGEKFTLELFGPDDFELISVNARIAGIKSIEKAQEERNGIFIVSINTVQPGISIHSEIVQLHPITVCIIVIVMLIILVFILPFWGSVTTLFAKVLIVVISFLCLFATLIAILTFFISLNLSYPNFSEWIDYFFVIVLLIAGILFGVILRRYLYKMIHIVKS